MGLDLPRRDDLRLAEGRAHRRVGVVDVLQVRARARVGVWVRVRVRVRARARARVRVLGLGSNPNPNLHVELGREHAELRLDLPDALAVATLETEDKDIVHVALRMVTGDQ